MVFAERGETISGGNFHGEYPAKVRHLCSVCLFVVVFPRLLSHFIFSQALDFLSIAVHELASISERRIERLCNPSLSELPAFLVNEGGLNSGFMIAHCTAAALGRCTRPNLMLQIQNENKRRKPPVRLSIHVGLLTQGILDFFDFSFREQGPVPSLLRGLPVH